MKQGIVRVDENIKAEVEKAIAGTKVKLGDFYDEAVVEKMKRKAKKQIERPLTNA